MNLLSEFYRSLRYFVATIWLLSLLPPGLAAAQNTPSRAPFTMLSDELINDDDLLIAQLALGNLLLSDAMLSYRHGDLVLLPLSEFAALVEKDFKARRKI